MDKVDEALDAIEKYIEDGSPLPSTKSPYWEASESVPIVRSELARLRVERDELRAAAKRLSEERQSGLASLDAWVQLRAVLSRTEGGEVGG